LQKQESEQRETVWSVLKGMISRKYEKCEKEKPLFGIQRTKNKTKKTLNGPSIVVIENTIIGALKTENSIW
jgi:hypothetical protein